MVQDKASVHLQNGQVSNCDSVKANCGLGSALTVSETTTLAAVTMANNCNVSGDTLKEEPEIESKTSSGPPGTPSKSDLGGIQTKEEGGKDLEESEISKGLDTRKNSYPDSCASSCCSSYDCSYCSAGRCSRGCSVSEDASNLRIVNSCSMAGLVQVIPTGSHRQVIPGTAHSAVLPVQRPQFAAAAQAVGSQ